MCTGVCLGEEGGRPPLLRQLLQEVQKAFSCRSASALNNVQGETKRVVRRKTPELTPRYSSA